jgi:hypothetical protein
MLLFAFDATERAAARGAQRAFYLIGASPIRCLAQRLIHKTARN